MPLASLADVLPAANAEGRAVAGLVALGWEDARAFVAAAEAEGQPVILQAGPGARAHMPVSVWGAMFRHLGKAARVPVVAHLDHGRSLADCEAAIATGFTSVMFDGSRLPLEENIAETRAVAEMAHAAGVSCEGEIGFVGYDAGDVSNPTDPDEAARFARETGVDAMAVSIGNVHLQTEAKAVIDWAALEAIAARTDCPLVLHGASGVPAEIRTMLARDWPVAKFNIGTELRQTFGQALRRTLAEDAQVFDRVAILSQIEPALRDGARRVIRELAPLEKTRS
ncbi:MAG: class II fructose-bisphosphate aldolase [Pseudomonadota bacterium]